VIYRFSVTQHPQTQFIEILPELISKSSFWDFIRRKCFQLFLPHLHVVYYIFKILNRIAANCIASFKFFIRNTAPDIAPAKFLRHITASCNTSVKFQKRITARGNAFLKFKKRFTTNDNASIIFFRCNTRHVMRPQNLKDMLPQTVLHFLIFFTHIHGCIISIFLLLNW